MINIKEIIKIIAVTIFFVLTLILILPSLDLLGGIKLFSVQSGSMEPVLPVGSMIITKPESQYEIGDIITIAVSDPSNTTVTHRITQVITTDNSFSFITKGDANEEEDSEPHPLQSVIGKVFFQIPLIGYIATFVRTSDGLILFVLVPAIVFIYSEIIKISKEVQKLRNKPI